MSTSGSTNFTLTRDQIIKDALYLLNVLGAEEEPQASDLAFCSRRLNSMVKQWMSQGLHLWALDEGILFLTKNTASYNLGNTASDAYCTTAADAVLTELGGDEAASQTALTVDDSTGMAANDIVGIELNDGTTHWSTISSVDSSTQITIADALASAAAENNNVYTFTNRITRPQRIHEARLVKGISTTTETPMAMVSRDDYFNLPTKTNNGTPVEFYYSPQLTSGKLYIWQRPEDTSRYIRFTYERILEDFDAAANNSDFPVEWLDALVYNLAVRVAPAFGRDQKIIATLAPMALSYLNDLLDYDNEHTSIQIQPGY